MANQILAGANPAKANTCVECAEVELAIKSLAERRLGMSVVPGVVQSLP